MLSFMNINSKERENTTNSTLLSWTKLPIANGEGAVVVVLKQVVQT